MASTKNKRKAAALKGWETRRKKAAQVLRGQKQIARRRKAAALKGWETRRQKAAKKEARRQKRQKKLVCKVLYDGHAENPPTEHFWSNIKELQGPSINGKLLRIPATDGVVTVLFKVVDAELLRQPDVEEGELFTEGQESSEDWETELDPEGFWSIFFDHVRESLPKNKEGKSDGTKSLMILKIEVCYGPGQVQAD